MENLAERLRSRPERKPLHGIDDSDDEPSMVSKKSQDIEETFERIVRPDAKNDSCQACGDGDDLLCCETCTCAYHGKCLVPPLRAPLSCSWRCPECVSPLSDVDKVLDSEMRPTLADDIDASNLGSKQIFVKQYLVKWKGLSYLHCTWVPEREFIKAYKALPRLKTEVNNFNKQRSSLSSSEDDYVAIRPEWTTVDRVLACRDGNGGKEYLVKWMELSYDECCWESEFDISSFQEAIDKFHKIQSRNNGSLAKEKTSLLDASEAIEKPKEFQHYESSPEFLSGGSLHPYQLEGLNFLRFAWFKQTHVILADEMGLGKTIQSIAFLASLLKENLYPHLVVAPLSTLRNWKREFATWAPQMNVVMYAGSLHARAIIREYEFHFTENYQKSKKNSSSQHVRENKQDRIKFDVLLTSYEMINMDTATLKSIDWECMIVDEGHRLENKDSKLSSALNQFSSKHRVLLTGSPLQNNLDDLFMLMHFLDAGKFESLEEFQEEFKHINQEEQISRLHKILSHHLLRRVKKDVMKDIPPKKEHILRVELSTMQKEYYKAILTRNYQILTSKAGAQISLNNVVMELRKLCCHPFMLEGLEPEETEAFNKLLLESSGKLQLLDKMLVQLKEQGHRVLIYSQFQHMLDFLEDYCNYRKWQYERIDGKVGGAERQVRMDRFNAKNSSKFCFLLSSRAGGLGINLATADTVIIYDSDWNPHADLQAMARAHQLGQTNEVMIFRFITRGTIEERMREMTKKKMVLEHLAVGRLKNQNFTQEELDDIIRYGSKELFVDDNDEAGKSRQIHYDDAAIARLLNREQVNDEEANLNDEEEDGFLKAFKVANFECVDEVEAEADVEEPMAPTENTATANISERANFWEDLLRERYESQKMEEFNSMGIGKRSRKQMVSMEDDGLAGLEDASSEGEDNNYEADLVDGEAVPSGQPAARNTFRKRSRGDASESLPLMEGEGKSFRVLGFNQSQRALFMQILMRFGVGEFDWAEFTPRLKQKSYEEIKNYGMLFLSHISEDITDSPTFLDGVPKEGLRVEDVLVRIAQLLLIRDKGKASSGVRGVALFGHDIISHYPGLKSGRFWTQEHDLILLRAVLKHGYGRWQAILDDRELQLQDVICREINLPIILPERAPQGQAPGVNQAHTQDTGTYQAQTKPNVSNAEIIANAGREINLPSTLPERAPQGQAPGVNQAHTQDTGTSQAQTKPNVSNAEIIANAGNGNENGIFQDSNIVYHFRERQRKQVEFIKKRVLLLERGLNAEYQKAYFANEKLDEMVTGHSVNDAMGPQLQDCHTQLLSHLPLVEALSFEEISAAACDDKSDRLNIPWVYNEMCKVLSENSRDSVNAFLSKEPASLNLRKNLRILEALDRELNLVFLPVKDDQKKEIHKTQNFDAQASCSETEKGAAPSDGSTVVSSSVSGTASILPSNSTVDKIMEDYRS